MVLISLLTPCKGRNSVKVSHPTLTHRVKGISSPVKSTVVVDEGATA